jgi:hypothetical protein
MNDISTLRSFQKFTGISRTDVPEFAARGQYFRYVDDFYSLHTHQLISGISGSVGLFKRMQITKDSSAGQACLRSANYNHLRSAQTSSSDLFPSAGCREAGPERQPGTALFRFWLNWITQWM